MATFIVDASNWNSAAFWSGISPADGDWLDLSALGSGFTATRDADGDGVLRISDGTTTFSVGSSGASGTNATLGSGNLDQFDVIAAPAGGATIGAGSGAQSLSGGAGDDVFTGGDGDDTLSGGTGNDTAIFSGNASEYTISADGAGGLFVTGPDGTDLVSDVETLQFADGNQSVSTDGSGVIVVTDASGGITRYGTDGDNSFGLGSNQTGFGGDGNDTITTSGSTWGATAEGGEGDDLLSGANGNQTFFGGTGDDTLRGGDDYGTQDVDVLDGGAGDDSISSGFTNTSGSAGTGDSLTGGTGNDTILGGAARDTIDAGADADTIDAGTGNDTVDAGLGQDTVDGGDGADLISGGEGNDAITGGAGNDTISGDGGPANGTDGVYNVNLLYTSITSVGSVGSTLDLSSGPATLAITDDDATLEDNVSSAPQTLDGSQQTLTEGFADHPEGSYVYSRGFYEVTNTTTGETGYLYQIRVDEDYAHDGTMPGTDGEYYAFNTGFTPSPTDTIEVNSTIQSTGNVDFSQMFHSSHDDVIDGGTGDDVIDGGAGSDTITGGGGDDSVQGGAGNDRISSDGNLLQDGDIEDDALTSGYTVNGNLGAWQSDTGVEVWSQGHAGISSKDGGDFIELDRYGSEVNNIYQDVETAAGETYTLSLDAMHRSGFEAESFEVYWDGTLVATVSPASASEWTTYDFTVTGTGGTDRLEIRELAGEDQGGGLFLDNFKLVASGDDTVDGGAGDDSIDGGAGDDLLTGGRDDDSYFSSLAEANLVQNASFEDDGPVTGSKLAPTGWTRGGVDDNSGLHTNAARATDGETSYAMGGWSNGTGASLSQDVSLPANDSYTVGFSIDNNWSANEGAVRLEVIDAGGNTLVDETVTITPGSRVDPRFEFTGDGDVTIRFTHTEGATGFDVDLDAVLLVPSSALSDSDTINAGDGDDTVDGGAGDDLLSGDAGADSITGGSGNDAVFGGDGNDTLSGGDGNDTLVGDDSSTMTLTGAVTRIDQGALFGESDITNSSWYSVDDVGYQLTVNTTQEFTINVAPGQDGLVAGSIDGQTVTGGDGVVYRAVLADNVVLTDGTDTYNATTVSLYSEDGSTPIAFNAFYIFPDGPPPTGVSLEITSRSQPGDIASEAASATGDDVIDGGAGDDSVQGNEGDDTLSGGGGNDILEGGDGNDSAEGGAGNDYVLGNDGNDILAGADGADTVRGGDGNDTAEGGEGNDVLTGDAGLDSIAGGGGNDAVFGGDGNDTLSGGDGNDTLMGDDSSWMTLTGAVTRADQVDRIGESDITSAVWNDVDDVGFDLTVNTTQEFMINIAPGQDGLVTGSVEGQTFTGDDGVVYRAVLADDVVLTDGTNTYNATTVSLYSQDGSVHESYNSFYIFPDGPPPTGVSLEVQSRSDPTDIAATAGSATGDDVLDGGAGNDSVLGNVGDDTLSGGDGADTLEGGDGNDVLYSASSGPETWGSDAGSSDLLDGGAGNDTLYADYEHGTTDTLLGGDGDDVLHDVNGSASLEGGAGNDTLYENNSDVGSSGGTDESDTLRGGDGNDFLGSDTAAGTSGVTDYFYGDAGNDTIQGSFGDDVIDGGEGSDSITMHDGFGNDTITGGETGLDSDTLDLGDLSAGVNATFSDSEAGNITQGADTIGFSGIERTTLTDHDDTVDATASTGGVYVDAGDGNNSVDGGSGNDSIIGRIGDDTINAGDGNDRVSVTGGNNDVDAGSGDDYVWSNNNAYSTVHAGDGNDTVILGYADLNTGVTEAYGEAGDDSLSGVNGEQALYGGDGNDTLVGGNDYGTLDTDTLDGGDGDDSIVSGANSGPNSDWWEARGDIMSGGAGNDTITGGTGNDQISGGTGADTMEGGAGADRFSFEDNFGNDTLTGGETGTDQDAVDFSGASAGVTIGGGADEAGTVTNGTDTVNFSEIEEIKGSDGGTDADLSSWTSSATLEGGAIADTLTGGQNADVITGDLGADTVDGGAGNDTIYGDNQEFTSVSITNHSFDDDDLSAGGTSSPTGWIATGPDSGAVEGTPNVTDHSQKDGANFGTIKDGGTLSQTLSETFEAGEDYQLTVLVAGNGATSPDSWEIRVFAGDEMLGSTGADTHSISPSVGQDISLVLRSEDLEAFAGEYGQNLRIELYDANTGNTDDVHFDNVRFGTRDATAGQDDVIDGGEGDNLIRGDGGNDSITAGTGDDTIQGGSGDDTIIGGLGSDSLAGGDGNDSLSARNGDNTLSGGDGDDTIDASIAYEDDSLSGGDGDDMILGAMGADTVDGGEGFDTYSQEARGTSQAVEINLADGTAILANEGTIQTLTSIEGAIGTALADTLTGSSVDNQLDGGDGDDILNGGAGADILNGGSGADTFVLGANFGADTISGGDSGSDIDQIDATALGSGVVVMYTGPGAGTLTSGGHTLTFSGIEDIRMTGYVDEVDASGALESVSLAGGEGDDILKGSALADSLTGGEGDDLLEGGEGDDLLEGGDGNDILKSGVGEDTLSGGDGNDTLMNSAGDDSLVGGTGDDLLVATAGNDTLEGGDGNDTLMGGTDNDSLDGGADNDLLMGDLAGVSFNETGNDGVGLAGNITDFPSSQLSYEITFSSSSTANFIPLASYAGPSSDNEFLLSSTNGTLQIQSEGEGLNTGISTAGLFDGGVHTLAVTWDSGTGAIEFFVDGSSVYTGTFNTGDTFEAGGTLAIGQEQDNTGGAFDSNQIFEGDIYGIRLYDDVRTPAELTSSALGPVADTTDPNLIANWVADPDSAGFTDLTGSHAMNLSGDVGSTWSDGNDTIDGGTGEDQIYGGGGNDSILGGQNNDTIDGGAGNDSIDGGTFEDLISGGTGNDTITGGQGQDTIDGGDGDDLIDETGSGNGHDLIFGGAGNDTLRGDLNDDTLDGGTGNDSLDGGVGTDSLLGGDGTDTLLGGDGDDTLDGGIGADVIDGGDGSDRVEMSDNFGADTVTGGEGGTDSDTLTFENVTTGISLGYQGGGVWNASDGADTARVSEFEIIDLTNQSDTLTGSANNTINMGAGDDTYINNGPHTTTVTGGAGNDTFNHASGGITQLDGGDDADTFNFINGWGNVTVSGGEGGTDTDEVDFSGTSSAVTVNLTGDEAGSITDGSDTITFSEIESFTLTSQDDTFADTSTTGETAPYSVDAGAGNDTITAGSSDSTLLGGTGDDVIRSGSADDIIDAGAGNDTIHASTNTTADSYDGGADTDTFSLVGTGVQSNAYNINLVSGSDNYANTYANIENFILGDGDDTITGNSEDNQLSGGDGSDTFIMQDGFGNDTITGGDGGSDNDILDLSGLTGPVTVTYTDSEDGTITDGTDTITFEGIEELILSDDADVVDASNDSAGVDIATGDGDDSVVGGSGNDTIVTGQGSSTLEGGDGNDSLELGGPNGENSSLSGGAGDDTLIAGEGNASGWWGNSTLDGGTGDDSILSGNGNQTVYGGDGNDTITGDPEFSTADSDALFGGSGDDVITSGFSGPDNATGGDLLDGGSGDDTLTGGDAIDTLVGGSGSDSLEGGAGNDSLAGDFAGGGLNETGQKFAYEYYELDGQALSSLADAGFTDGTTNINPPDGQGAVDSIDVSAIDTHHSGNLDSFAVKLTTTLTITSGGTYDFVLGSDDGAKLFVNGEEVISRDGVTSYDTTAGSTSLGAGEHVVEIVYFDQTGLQDLGLTMSGPDTANTPVAFETANIVSNFDDTIDGGTGSDTLLGGLGDDVLSGGDDADTFILEDGFGDDTIAGGEGGTDDDLIDLSTMGDPVTVTFTGSEQGNITSGSDTVTFSEIERVVTSDEGDVIDASGQSGSVGIDVDSGGGNDTITGGNNADTIVAGSGNDSVDAGSGADSIDSGDGNDTVFGDGGLDTLDGGDGADSLDGGGSADSLTGGTGDDTLTGGAGNDTFVYTAGDGHDTITDFNAGNTGTLTDGDDTNNDFIDLTAFYDDLWEIHADQADDGILNQSNDGVEGADYSDNTQFGLTNSLTFTGASANNTSFTSENTGVVCFTKGTAIRTPRGDVLIEDLRPGDLVSTLDNGPRPVVWIGRSQFGPRQLEANPKLRPVLIKSGVLGAERNLLVSRQHGMLVGRHLTRAVHLVDRPGIRIANGIRNITYIHLMFEEHQIVFAENTRSESFYPGPWAVQALAPGAKVELRALCPRLSLETASQFYGPTARAFSKPEWDRIAKGVYF